MHNRSLDLVRGIAAILVVLGHSREVLFESFGRQLRPSSLIETVLLAPSSFAGESVAVFFVLSGFLVGGAAYRAAKLDSFAWRPYVAKRISRLSTVLIPGLVFTAVADYASRTQWGSRIPENSSVWDFACNALFLQKRYCEPFGSNGSLWSLSYEFWFYIFGAAAIVLCFSVVRRDLKNAAISALICILVVVLFGLQLLAFIPAWGLGALIAIAIESRRIRLAVSRSRGIRNLWIFGSIAFLGAACVLSNYIDLATSAWPLMFLLIGVATIPLILTLAVTAPANDAWLVGRLSFLGVWSYTIYVYHKPIITWLVGAVSEYSLSSWQIIAGVYLIGAAAVGISIPFYFAFERHTPKVRDLLLKVLRVYRPQGPRSHE